ncbi:hypothetical protein MRB53_015046 [Persea americana]|uniref:Uncharacterized protein n=1 Tax=Persea americana TaxID=3435 RepID=A0ACC2KCL4_PERAE|nr:hypothetical protein MRB53_015046 [Persea americana]
MFSMGFHALKVQETILVSVASRAGPSLSWVELQKRRSRRMGHYSIAEPGPTAEVHDRTIAEAESGLTVESDGPEQRMTVPEEGQEGTCVKLVNDATEKLVKMVMRWCIVLYRHEKL